MEILKIQDYLMQVLNCHVTLSPVEQDGLPFFIRKAFAFYVGELCSTQVHFLVGRMDKAIAIKEIESVAHVFGNNVSTKMILVFPDMARSERLSLIKRRIAFLVPGKQMFLPYLGIDFSERIKEQREAASLKLRPIAQEILIEYLSDNLNPVKWPLSGLASYMKYTSMGVLRAVNQLAELNMCRVESDGYRKTVHFDTDKEALWKRALPYLQSPVRKVVAIVDDSMFRNGEWLYAGEYALARHSSLAVRRPCYAVYEKTYNELLKEGKIHLADTGEEGVADIQIWRYHLSREGSCDTVDLLSLELSFRGESDPRIKDALEQMKENKIW